MHDPYVDGRPASVQDGLSQRQAAELDRLARDVACGHCGAAAVRGSALTALPSRHGGAEAWRCCGPCSRARARGAAAVARDVLDELSVPTSGVDPVALERAASQLGVPAAFAATQEPQLASAPDAPPLDRRWAQPEIADYLKRLQQHTEAEAIGPSPAGTPCHRCGVPSGRDWHRPVSSEDGWNSSGAGWLCGDCQGGWGPRGPLVETTWIKDLAAACGATAYVRATPWDAAALASAGIRTREARPGLATLSGWFPASSHRDWPRFPASWGPWDYLPAGTAALVEQWARYLRNPVGSPPPRLSSLLTASS